MYLFQYYISIFGTGRCISSLLTNILFLFNGEMRKSPWYSASTNNNSKCSVLLGADLTFTVMSRCSLIEHKQCHRNNIRKDHTGDGHFLYLDYGGSCTTVFN